MGVVSKSIKEGASTCIYRNSGNYRVEIFRGLNLHFLIPTNKRGKVCARNFRGLGQPRKYFNKTIPELQCDLRLRHIQYREYCNIIKMESL